MNDKKKYSLAALVFGAGLAVGGTALAGAGTDSAAAQEGKGDHACAGHEGKGAGRLSRLDTDQDGKVTLAELTASREAWLTKLDTNKDGAVTTAEFDSGRQAKHAERAARMFERKDVNKDGRISRDETRMPERWFTSADANKDGALTREELAAAPKPGGKGFGGRHGGDMFGRLDDNRDGKVDRREVQKAAADMLQRLDTNKDGSLAADELRGPGKHGRFRHGPRGGEGQTNTPPPAGNQRS